jgi:serine/threonine-protein kinase RsbW
MIGRYSPHTGIRSARTLGRLRHRRRTPHLPGHGMRAPETALQVTLPRATWTVPLARRLARHLLRRAPIGAEGCTAVEIAVGEACSNAVRHAAPASHYELKLRLRDASCLVEVTDAGKGFDLRHDPDMPGTRAVSGRGLPLIARVTDQLEVCRQAPTGTLLRFVKNFDR